MEEHIKTLQDHADEAAAAAPATDASPATVGRGNIPGMNKPTEDEFATFPFNEGEMSDNPWKRPGSVQPDESVPSKIPANDFDALDQHDVEYTPAQRSKFLDETGLPASIGNTKGATEVGTVASPVRKLVQSSPAAVETPGEVGGRDIRQLITDHEDQANNLIPGTKMTPAQRARAEVGDALRGVLDKKVAAVNPDASAQLAELNRKTSALVRIKNAAQYKTDNSRVGNQSRLAVHGHNVVNRILHGSTVGIVATELATGHPAAAAATLAATGAVKLGPKVVRAADEALANLARTVRSGGNAQAAVDKAIAAGVRAPLAHALAKRLVPGAE